MNKKVKKRVSTLSVLSVATVLPSLVSSSGVTETFIAKINGVTKLSKSSSYYYAKVKIENGVLKDIQEVPQKELKNYKDIFKSNSKNEIELFYPSDYKIQITQEEKSSAKKNKEFREKNWNQILKRIKEQNVIAKDSSLDSLSVQKRKKSLKKAKPLG